MASELGDLLGGHLRLALRLGEDVERGEAVPHWNRSPLVSVEAPGGDIDRHVDRVGQLVQRRAPLHLPCDRGILCGVATHALPCHLAVRVPGVEVVPGAQVAQGDPGTGRGPPGRVAGHHRQRHEAATRDAGHVHPLGVDRIALDHPIESVDHVLPGDVGRAGLDVVVASAKVGEEVDPTPVRDHLLELGPTLLQTEAPRVQRDDDRPGRSLRREAGRKDEVGRLNAPVDTAPDLDQMPTRARRRLAMAGSRERERAE